MRSVRLPLAIDTRRLRSFDGTEIAYHVTEAPYPGAPWIVLANGLGGSSLVWRGQIDYLSDRHRFVSWDYRGLYASERPRPERAGAYSVSSHVRDLAAVLAAERIERAGLWGWSAGVQVAIEAFAQLPRARAGTSPVSSLVLVNGTWGRPLDALTSLRPLRAAILPFLELLRRAHAFGPLAHHPVGRRNAALWMKRLGLVGGEVDPIALADLTIAVGRLDVDAFLRNLVAFGEHDAAATLDAIDVPTLVIAGDQDPLASRGASIPLARRIRGAELLVLPGGGHCAPIEHPDLISLRIERFYRERGG
jgi:pimeloyl-ACP methyl ester carboxylesterase